MSTKKVLLGEVQKGIYFESQIQEAATYNISTAITLNNVEINKLERAFQLLILEQEVLRGSIKVEQEELVLRIDDESKAEEFQLKVCETSEKLQIEEILKEEGSLIFELDKAPLIRATLINGQEESILHICVHHIICDGISMSILVNRLIEIYQNLKEGKGWNTEVNGMFTEFIEKENCKLREGKYNKQKEFWQQNLLNATPIDIQVDYLNNGQGSGVGREKRFNIPLDMFEKLKKLAVNQEVSVFMLLLSSFGVILKEYARQEDIVIASPFSYRPSFDLEDTIGCFIYTLPLRFSVNGKDKFSNVMSNVSKVVKEAYKNIGYPNNLIARDNGLLSSGGSPSIFDISFVYDEYDIDQKEVQFVYNMDYVTFPGNIMVIIEKIKDNISLKIQYKPEIYSSENIEYMGQRFIRVLEQVQQNVDIEIDNINLFLEDEKEDLLYGLNNSQYFEYIPKNIIEVFEEKVNKYPNDIGLLYKDEKFTYTEINRKANQLAYKILEVKQKANDIVGIQLKRSPELVIAILAVLKSGCAYVPIDESYPSERKSFIVKDASINILLTEQNLSFPSIEDLIVLHVDQKENYSLKEDNLDIERLHEDIAYIEYTSGSTGIPKGVIIENRSITNTVLDLERRFPLNKEDVYMFKTPYTFDIAGTEIYGWIVGKGSLLVLEDEGQKNPNLILECIERYKVTHINFVPSVFRIFLELFQDQALIPKLNSLKYIFVGGEAITPDIIDKFFDLRTDIKLENVYGPTEATMWATHYPIRKLSNEINVCIGRPLNEYRCYIVKDDNKLQPTGIAGELCISGAGLARGYLNREQLTAEKFVDNPFYNESKDKPWYKKMYRTGDLARWLPDGTLEFMGRIDFQVKIGGVRIELGEIENALSKYEGIMQVVAVTKKHTNGHNVICAYYVSEQAIPVTQLRSFLSKEVPPYMIPTFFVHRKEMPLSSNGKVNRNILIADTTYIRDLVKDIEAPVTELEIKIAEIWKEILLLDEVSIDDNFFTIGGHSLALMQVHSRLKQVLQKDFSITELLRLPTIRLLGEYFTEESVKEVDRAELFRSKKKILNNKIAIIGMAVNVPASTDTKEFWENLKLGKECIHFYSDEELLNLGVSESLIKNPNYIKAKGRIEDLDYFDSTFFGTSPKEVKMTSPQLRVLYKGIWEAMEDAGYYPGATDDRVGVFLGGSDDFKWYQHALFNNSNYSDTYQSYTLSTNHFLATRLSYKFNLTGPAFTALTGCSTSLVTTHLACQSLILGECDVAIAGGVTVELPNEGGYLYEDGMMFSPDGRCHPFDKDAKGTVFSNGMGLVVLKPLDKAIEDGDHIYATIIGSAINNDGNKKMSYTAPSEEGQVQVIRQAYANAEIDPETVGYIEAHGTGTILGDPIEVTSLSRAFATNQRQYCVLGSIKGNIGHTDTAAGVVGLIKVALALNNKFLPATVNYDVPNPKIDFASTPFVVNSEGKAWSRMDKDIPLRAGINSFGVGGTNAHMILEEAPIRKESSQEKTINLCTFSAKTETALNNSIERILTYIAEHDINMSDASYMLQTGREAFNYRKTVILDKEFKTHYKDVIEEAILSPHTHLKKEKKPIYFLFSGQGSQYQGMGKMLYEGGNQYPISKKYREHVDEIFSLLPQDERYEFFDIIYGNTDAERINQTKYSQFALFVTEYAMAKVLIELGIKPKVLLGHSIGEVIAATIAEVWSLEDAVKIVRLRGDLMQAQEPGVMLAITGEVEEIKKLLIKDVWISLSNTTNKCVVGGKTEQIAIFEEKLKELDIKATRLKTSHAFHTPMMHKAKEAFKQALENIQMNEPKYPIISNVTGQIIKPSEMITPQYWADHIANTVRFCENLAYVMQENGCIGIEIGAGRTLASFALQHNKRTEKHVFLNILPHIKEKQNMEYIYNKLGKLWCEGINLDWTLLEGDTVRNKVSLPTYVFDKIHYPIKIQADNDQLKENVFEADEVVSTSIAVSYNNIKDENVIEQAIIDAYKEIFGFETIEPTADFFDIGGDSLKGASLIAVLKNILGIKVSMKDIFNNTTPRQLANSISKNNEDLTIGTTIKPAKLAEYYPLSSSQKRMYTFYLMDKEALTYNLSSATLIEGRLEEKRTKEAIYRLMKRHESLRTTFTVKNGEIVQIINEITTVPVKFTKATCETEEDFNNILKLFIKPFDIEKGPLFRVQVVEIGENKQILLFDIHHIIADGTAVEIISRDFNSLYFKDLGTLHIQYKDYAIWQNDYMQSKEMSKKKDFWLNVLSGQLPTLELPTDFERPRVKSFEGSRLHFTIEKDLFAKIKEVSRKHGTTNFMTTLSAWNILLSRYSGQEEIIVGTPVSGRNLDEIRDTVGMFVNMLPIRSFPSRDKKFATYLEEVKEIILAALNNQEYQFDILVDDLSIERKLNRNPIFDVSFDYHNMEIYDLEIEGMRFVPYEMPVDSVSVDLLLTCNENQGEQLECFIDYSTALFSRETIERLAQHYINILKTIVIEEQITLGEITYLTTHEKQMLLEQACTNYIDIDKEVLIQELFERNVELMPDKVALITSIGKEITYSTLNYKANKLARKLIEIGIRHNDAVGIMCERDENLIIAIIGVLKAGGAYVPIDPKFPEDRIKYMLSETKVSVVICTDKYEDNISFEGTKVNCTQLCKNVEHIDNLARRSDRESLAYIIFTSGSTGQPKGVMVKQEGVVNLIYDHINRQIFSKDDDRIACIATPSFDIFVFESLLPLCTGHSLYLANEIEQLDVAQLSEKMIQHQVTHIQGPVSRLRVMLESKNFASVLEQLRVIVGGGENYPVALVEYLQKNTTATLYNMYGPTETTITATIKDLTHASKVNIGSAISNTQIFILNENNRVQPIGILGEICIAGRGLTRGYLNNEEETSKKFITLPENAEISVYKTGDSGRMLSNGEIEIVGRLDSQVKIHGYRIELSEIEKIALSDVRVSYAVAKVLNNKDNPQIALFYSLRADQMSHINEDLRTLLQEHLPNYMVPSYINYLDRMPLLPNGKVDQAALKVQEKTKVVSKALEDKMTVTYIEKAIIEIWKDVLNISKVSIKDNFFDKGGNSYGLMLVNNLLNELLGYNVPLMQLFENPTIESLVKSLNISDNSQLLDEVKEEKIEVNDDIAVIGMYCRFPDAEGVEALWENLMAGKESIKSFTEEELKSAGLTQEEIHDSRYVNAKGYLEGVEYFDAEFFGYSRKEASIMDPQIRLFHMCVWKALENAGYNSYDYNGKIGLFGGSGANILWLSKFLDKQDNSVGAFEAMTLNDKDFLTTKISYKLNLKGPSMNMQTACSTSLVAIHQAIKYLQCGETDIAVAGGVSISYPRREGYLWHEGMIYSKDGHCRPFSDGSSGTVSGNGCGVVVLKKLNKAIEDNDYIYAVVKGSAMNNDGNEKIGYTAPSISGQREVIQQAIKNSGIKPEEINYVEAHGTGTILGDPIEVEALRQAWKTQKKTYCALGSIKANIGHLDAASGVAGFIKAVMVLNKKEIPPLINYQGPNPKLDIDNSPFYINTSSEKIETNVARAAISAFGIGGTNVHMILEEAPKESYLNNRSNTNVLLFSGRSQSALINTSKQVLKDINYYKEYDLTDIAWTLQVGRNDFEYRKVLVVEENTLNNNEYINNFINQEGIKALEEHQNVVIALSDGQNKTLKVAKGLYENQAKKYIDDVLDRLTLQERINCREVLLQEGQPTLMIQNLCTFTSNYACIMLLKEFNITPEAILVKGIGKLSGLVAAEALSIVDAIDMIREGCTKEIDANNYPEYQWFEPKIPVVMKLTPEVIGEKDTIITIGDGLITDNQVESIDVLEKDTLTEQSFYNMLGKLWCKGYKVDWSKLYTKVTCKRVPLSGYVFDKTEFDSDVILANSMKQKIQSSVEDLKADIVDTEADVMNVVMEVWKDVLGINHISSKDDFFELGGDSLNAILMSSIVHKRIGVEITIEETFKNSTLEKMSKWLYENRSIQDFEEIAVIPTAPYYATSSAQQRMYTIEALLDGEIPYNLASVYSIEGTLDRFRLSFVFDELVRRHESFRTSFGMIDNEIVQYIAEDISSIVEYANVKEEDLQEEIDKSIKPFDLAKAPLIRVKVLSLNEQKHVLIIDMHHIISDQTSINILLEEIYMLYTGQSLPKIPVRYIDFTAWQNKLLQSGKINKQIDYWRKELSGELPKVELYTDYVRTQDMSRKGKLLRFTFDEKEKEDINIFTKRHHITPYMLMMSTLKLLLWKSSNQKDMIVGTAVAGRRHLVLQSIVGMFVNMLPIRSQIDETLSVKQYLEYMKEKMVAAFENQDCQLEMLLETLNIRNYSSNSPLFDIVINYVKQDGEDLELEGLVLKPVQSEEIDTKYDITLTIVEKVDGYDIELEYVKALYAEDTMQAFGERFISLVKQLMNNEEYLLQDLCITTQKEETLILKAFNNQDLSQPIHKNVVEIFEEQVDKNGESIALVWRDESYTYKMLNNMVNQLAYELYKANVRYGDRVVMLLERGPLQVVSILAILKCGAVYIPVDVTYPEERISFMVEDSNSTLTITHSSYREKVGNKTYLIVDKIEDMLDPHMDMPVDFEHTPKVLCSEDEAYVIYTSGSTGQPKGVALYHRGIIRTCVNANYFKVAEKDVVAQMANYTFDASVWEIFGALLTGAKLVMIPKDILLDMSQLSKVLHIEHVTKILFITAVFNMFVDYNVEALKGIETIYVGGEAMSLKHTKKALACVGEGHLVNLYGPTETTVCVTAYPVNYIAKQWTSIPIGKAISNTTLYVLDEYGNLLPPKVPGELCIGGSGLGKGYLNRDELNKEKFINLKFGNKERVYRTGDKVVITEDGNITFLGRIDFQIKLRGFRIELEEIEKKIAFIDGVKDAVVVAKKDEVDSLYLAAYYTINDAQNLQLSPSKVKKILSKQLPDYMIPSRIKCMEQLPINANGKVDRKALPVIEEEKVVYKYDAPTNVLQQQILEIMQQVIGNNNIGIKDDFFEVGGQSIKAITFTQKLRELGKTIRVNDIFNHRSAEELAEFLSSEETTTQVAKTHIGTSVLNQKQIEHLAQYINKTAHMLSDMLAMTSIKTSFELSSVQQLHMSMKNRTTGFTMCVEYSEQELRQIVASLVVSQQLLHAVYIKQKDIYIWHELNVAELKDILSSYISVIDLQMYDIHTQEAIIRLVSEEMLQKEYQEGEILWNVCCLKLGPAKIQLIWSFDHVCFDGMSAEIIKRQIEMGIKEVSHESYESYINTLKDGPLTISQTEIVDYFKLEKWQKANVVLLNTLKGNSEELVNKLTFNIPIDNKQKNTGIWEYAYDIVIHILKEYTHLDTIPMAILNYGRQYGERKFFNCVGEFLDIVPIIEQGESEEVSKKIEMCKKHNLNFLSLVYDLNLQNQYKEVVNHLSECFKTENESLDLVLYNFQGFITEEEKKLFEGDTGLSNENYALANLYISANYDNDTLYISIQCVDGLDKQKLISIIKKING